MARPVSPAPGPSPEQSPDHAPTSLPETPPEPAHAPTHSSNRTMPAGPWSPTERGKAWAVHGFTALGIVASMLALRDVLTGHPSYAILWLLLTLVIDGVDGPMARAVRVSERVPKIDGYTLDLIIDYVACVIVPACFMYEFEVVPQNNFGIAVLCLLVATSAIWFARRDMMTDDFFFRGFPAAWNNVAPAMFLLDARTTVGAIVTIVLSLLCLTNLPFPHVMRARFLRLPTVAASVLWVGGILWGTFTYPDDPYAVRPMIYLGMGYFFVLAAIKMVRDRGNPPGIATEH